MSHFHVAFGSHGNCVKMKVTNVVANGLMALFRLQQLHWNGRNNQTPVSTHQSRSLRERVYAEITSALTIHRGAVRPGGTAPEEGVNTLLVRPSQEDWALPHPHAVSAQGRGGSTWKIR